MLHVGVIGTGGMGGRHARNLAQRVGNAQVVAVMDTDAERAAGVAAECGGAKVYTEAEALITDPAVEAVVIASPGFTHAQLAKDCLAAGKPVLCEKPLASSTAEALTVVQAEMAVGRRLLQVGFMREYDPAHTALKDVLQQGEIGQPLLFKGLHVNVGGRAMRTVEDVIINSAIHDLHSVRWLLGGEIAVAHVQSIPYSADRPETCRLVTIHLQMANGALAFIECNPDSGYAYEVDVTITTERGSVQTNSLRSPWMKGSAGAFQPIEPDWLVRFDTAYLLEAEAWVRSVLDRKPSGPTAWDGYASLVVADACIESARTGHPVAVVLPQRPEMYDRASN